MTPLTGTTTIRLGHYGYDLTHLATSLQDMQPRICMGEPVAAMRLGGVVYAADRGEEPWHDLDSAPMIDLGAQLGLRDRRLVVPRAVTGRAPIGPGSPMSLCGC